MIGPYVNIIAPAAVFVIGLTLLLLFKNETVKGAGVSLLVAAAGAFLGKLP